MPIEGFVRQHDIDDMRVLRNERLVHLCTLMEVTHARASIGFTESEVVTQTNVRCLAMPSGGTMRALDSSRETAVQTYEVEFDVFAPVKPNTRLYVSGKMNGVDFTLRLGVTSVNVPRGVAAGMKATATTDPAVAGSGPPPA